MGEILGTGLPEELLAAYQTAIDTYQISIVRFLYRVTGNLNLAAGLARDAFINAYLHTTEQNLEGDLKTGIYRSAVQTATRYYTPKKSWLPLFTQNSTKVAATEINITDEPADRIEIQRILTTLPVINRVCTALHFVEGFSYARISELTGLTTDTVRDKIYEVKKEFFPCWKRDDACTKIAVLLSAYVDREADTEQRSQVESHLAQCGVCRKTLENYRQTRETLCSLWLTPPLPDIKVDTVTRLRALPPLSVARAQKRKQKNRLKLSLLTSMSVLAVILALPLVLHADDNYNVTALITRVHAATDKVSTFKMDMETTDQINQNSLSTYNSLTQWEFAGRDYFHFKDESTTGTITTLYQEEFVLGSDIYWNNLSTSNLIHSNIPIKALVPTDLYDYLIPDYVIELKKLGNETINNVNCVHLRGALDVEKYLLKMYAPLGIMSRGNNSYTITMEGSTITSTLTLEGNTVTIAIGGNNQTVTFRTNPVVIATDRVIVDFWIGKEDCLIRKKVETIQSHSQRTQVRTTVIATSFLTYPAQPLVINPPLANDGSLLQNWQLYVQQNGAYIRVR